MQETAYIRVPYGSTVHGEEEINAVVEVLRTSTQMGKNVREMEERVASLFHKKYGIMVNSGSSALYLAAELMNFEPGTEIITPV
jgi:Predicted pyridoxal phosphate-dependent enzyme apparently involved in regulation of cell wall biogenesis